MAELTLRYDTVALGRKNDRLNVPEAVSELLEEYFLFFDIIQKIEHREDGYGDRYEFVPVWEKGAVDFRLYRKNGYDPGSSRIKQGIEQLARYLYQ